MHRRIIHHCTIHPNSQYLPCHNHHFEIPRAETSFFVGSSSIPSTESPYLSPPLVPFFLRFSVPSISRIINNHNNINQMYYNTRLLYSQLTPYSKSSTFSSPDTSSASYSTILRANFLILLPLRARSLRPKTFLRLFTNESSVDPLLLPSTISRTSSSVIRPWRNSTLAARSLLLGIAHTK